MNSAVLLLIQPIVLAALAPPDRLYWIVWMLPDDVDVSPVDDFLAGGHMTTITARKGHLRDNSAFAKDHAAWRWLSRFHFN